MRRLGTSRNPERARPQLRGNHAPSTRRQSTGTLRADRDEPRPPTGGQPETAARKGFSPLAEITAPTAAPAHARTTAVNHPGTQAKSASKPPRQLSKPHIRTPHDTPTDRANSPPDRTRAAAWEQYEITPPGQGCRSRRAQSRLQRTNRKRSHVQCPNCPVPQRGSSAIAILRQDNSGLFTFTRTGLLGCTLTRSEIRQESRRAMSWPVFTYHFWQYPRSPDSSNEPGRRGAPRPME